MTARQKGASAVLALFGFMAGLVLLGLVLDLGHLVVQRTRLDAAVEAAARAVNRACAPGSGAACASPVAAQYLQANLPLASLQAVTNDASGIYVQAYVVAPYFFGALWARPSATLTSEFRLAPAP